MTDVVIRTAYDPRERVAKDCGENMMTKQSFKDECDVNNIMNKFRRDGLLTHVAAVEGRYGDFGDVGSFHEAMNTVRTAQEMFETVPSEIRAEFGNDPGAFLDWAVNADEAALREKGLLPPASVDPDPDPAPGAPGGAPPQPAAALPSAAEGDSGPGST